MDCKHGDELELQEGLPEELIKELLVNRDYNKAYKILFQAAIIYYHLQDKNCFETSDDFLTDFPFCQRILDAHAVVMPMLTRFDKELNIWNPNENKAM